MPPPRGSFQVFQALCEIGAELELTPLTSTWVYTDASGPWERRPAQPTFRVEPFQVEHGTSE